jgi:tetratricopeptide (TPR) repeat protein
MPIDLSEALECHRLGLLDRAAGFYEAALAEDPARDEALHFLGLVKLQCGDPTQAAVLIGRAIDIRATEAAYHASLAEARWALGQLARAAESCRTALTSVKLTPRSATSATPFGSGPTSPLPTTISATPSGSREKRLPL